MVVKCTVLVWMVCIEGACSKPPSKQNSCGLSSTIDRFELNGSDAAVIVSVFLYIPLCRWSNKWPKHVAGYLVNKTTSKYYRAFICSLWRMWRQQVVASWKTQSQKLPASSEGKHKHSWGRIGDCRSVFDPVISRVWRRTANHSAKKLYLGA
jgi:hypothetical protein